MSGAEKEKREQQGDLAIELDDRKSTFDAVPSRSHTPAMNGAANGGGAGSVTNNPAISILCYCGSSILMTVTNKYVLSGTGFNLNFFLLCVQSVVCIVAIQACKQAGLITFRDFNTDEARKWFPISVLLIGMIYTSTKALQFLS
ncbi:GDP-mannose transporter, partial [Hortaea werneckii]